MKNILLIEPSKIITDQKNGINLLAQYIMPSLGLLSIGTVLKNNNNFVKYFSPNLDYKNWRKKLKKILSQKQFDYVGISTTAYTIEADMEIAFFIRKIRPRIKIVAGGYFTHLYPKTILKYTEVDIVIRGDGEFPFLQILNCKTNLRKIPGVCFKYNQGRKNKYYTQKPFFMNQNEFNKLPPLNFSLYDFKKVWIKLLLVKNQINLFTSKGCPFSCRFCSVPYFNNKMMRFLPLKTTKENIIRAVKRGAKKIFIIDPNFTANPKYCLGVCDLIIRLKKEKIIDKKIYFLAQVRIDLVDQILLEKMAEAGLRYLFIGIENVSQRLLKDDIGKKNWLTKYEVKKQIQQVINYKINPFIYLILGLPMTSMKELKNNILFANNLRKDRIRIEINPFVTLFPETEYYYLYKNTKFISWKKIILKKFDKNKTKCYSLKLPDILWPKDCSVKKILIELENKTNAILNKRKGLLFDNVFIREAVKKLNKKTLSGQ